MRKKKEKKSREIRRTTNQKLKFGDTDSDTTTAAAAAHVKTIEILYEEV